MLLEFDFERMEELLKSFFNITLFDMKTLIIKLYNE